MRWELLSSVDKDFVLAEAVARGWADNKVQVKKYSYPTEDVWTIEPYEQDCRCRRLVKYEDYIKGLV